VFLLAMLIERTVFLFLGTKVNVAQFLMALRRLVDAGDLDRARKLTKALRAPVGRVCRAGLENLGKGPFWLNEELDRVIAAELPTIRRRLGHIPLLALGIAAVGVLASVLSGASSSDFGGDGPLPFGLALEYAPALVGVVSAIVGGLWGVTLSRRATQAVAELEQCKAFVLEVDSR
jgi:hypothetical protein